jgi:hypothetical protein
MNYTVIDYNLTHQPTKGEFGQLVALARQLIGERVLFGTIGYPRELTIHFGTPSAFKGPEGIVITEGSSVLGAIGSAWRIKSSQQGRNVTDYAGFPSARNEPFISESEVEKFVEQLGGVTVRDVDVFKTEFGYGLRVSLSDGSLIEFYPTPDHFEIEIEADEDFPIPPPDWELFTPYKRYLRVGPGTEWAYLPSDEPEQKKDR